MRRTIRQSQTLVPFGVGGIYDIQGESLIACDIFRWGKNAGDVVVSPRLTEALRIRELRSAPVASDAHWAKSRTIPYARFPSWLFCNRCRYMLRWNSSREVEDQRPLCPRCTGKRPLAPMRWIQICPQGHAGDVDWLWFAHHRADDPEQRQCQTKDKLQFRTSGRGGGGLDTLVVRCAACGAGQSLQGITSAGSAERIGRACSGRQPWQRLDQAEACTAEVKIVQRGASNVYYPVVHSSIEIPSPSSALANTDLALEVQNHAMFTGLLSVKAGDPLEGFLVNAIASGLGVGAELVRSLAADARRDDEGLGTVVDAAPGDLLAEEWAAFLTPTDDPDHPDFVTRHVGLKASTDPLQELLADRLTQVVVADRLREVRALQGFHRVTPAPGTMVRADLGRNLPWLPAVEVRGEGIFIALDEARLSLWENEASVASRAEELAHRLGRSFQRDRLQRQTGSRLMPRYVLIHTLAHLLIRRLAFETGYSASSLRERIYARSSDDEAAPRQAGVLIYTAAGDSEGTLGGLVRQGEPPRFVRTLLEAIQDGRWCSADPLCVESHATSFDSLNQAACHACCLISETSCEAGNFLLDRVMVVGNGVVPGYFEPVMEAALKAAAQAVR